MGTEPLEDATQIPTNWIATVGWTRTLSTALLNQFRANVTRWHYDQTNPTGTTNWGIPQIRLFDFDAGGFGDPGRIIGAGRQQHHSRQTRTEHVCLPRYECEGEIGTEFPTVFGK